MRGSSSSCPLSHAAFCSRLKSCQTETCGSKATKLGDKQRDERLSLSGIVRQRDVSADNAIPRQPVGDLKLALNGKGVASSRQSTGWLFRFLIKFHVLTLCHSCEPSHREMPTKTLNNSPSQPFSFSVAPYPVPVSPLLFAILALTFAPAFSARKPTPFDGARQGCAEIEASRQTS